MSDYPTCYGRHDGRLALCEACYAGRTCAHRSREVAGEVAGPSVAPAVRGEIEARSFHLGYTLASGQLFRWGRDTDGWWKGIAWGTAFHLRQSGDRLRFSSSAERVHTYAGTMGVSDFLRWYLRLDEAPRFPISRSDRHLREARNRLRGFRFARQEPYECIISYVLSGQARMSLTKQRIGFLARILGDEIRFGEERYWTFPRPDSLCTLNGSYFRHQRFGWRSDWVATTAGHIAQALRNGGGATGAPLEHWRAIADDLRRVPGTGVGPKVAGCIDLFALDRLHAVPVDTWVLKLARDWYGIEGGEPRVRAWAEQRGGKWAGYINEYLFAYYRELNATLLHDRVISFCASDVPSPDLPFTRA